MRLKSEIKEYLINSVSSYFEGSELFIFGSRTDDKKRGGDIDLLLLSKSKIDIKRIRSFKIEFYKKFGWQKIDLVNFTKEEKSTFKDLIMLDAIELKDERKRLN